MGFFNCCKTTKVANGANTSIQRTGTSGEKPKGVSVHWLQTGFMEEVKSTKGLSENSNIYQIENLSSDTNGVIRSKGEDVLCPFDGRMGAAYVECLDGEDNVGPANVMLSYGWRYEIKDIVDTLVDYCKSSVLDPKRTYIWICCMCNNQHRVVESRKDTTKKTEDTFDEFQTIFHDRVVGIGHIVALMTPWEKPVYLTRIWCIFELYIASQNENCQLTIAMPPVQKKQMVTALRKPAGVEHLYTNLTKTKVENAEASEELDRVRILEMVRNGPGYHELNRKVNMLLRNWIGSGLMGAVRDYEKSHDDLSGDLEYASLCNDIGKVLVDQGNHDEASRLYTAALAIYQTFEDEGSLDDDHRRELADTYNNHGLLLKKLGTYKESKEEFQKAMKIGKTVWSDNDYDAGEYKLSLSPLEPF